MLKPYTVLIVDDEEDMRNMIEMYMLNSGFTCIQAENGREALNHIENEKVDIVLLDIMMPGEDGFDVCENIRKISDVAVIFVSAKGEEWDKVKGLKLGADDFVVKPFHPGELVARVEAVLRRLGKVQKNQERDVLNKGQIKVQLKSRRVEIGEEAINLTLKEYELLLFMIKHESQALSREQLLEYVWGADYDGSLRTVDTHIKTLRMKLKHADYIQTVWGIGYKFEVNDEAK